HHTEDDAKSGANGIPNFDNYPNTASPETIWVRVVDENGCVRFSSFQISTTAPEEMTYELPTLEYCSTNDILIGIPFNLTENEEEILNGNNPDDFIISYHLNQNDAMNGIAAIADPANYENTASPQIIW